VSAENELNKKRLDHAMQKITQLTKTEENWETKCQTVTAQYEHLTKSFEVKIQEVAYGAERIQELECTRNTLKDELQKFRAKNAALEKEHKVLKTLYSECK
jgi:chromosome segregation ATPase